VSVTPNAPSRIGVYPVERELGRGGMGVVYLARDPRLDRPVAIKVLPDAFADDPERVARFEREARLLASLHHANIGGIYGLEETDGRRFLTLEYVEGDTLAERLARSPLPVDEALDVCRQIAAALEAAHENGIIHRDLKPGNVKLTPTGEVKVLDFGLAKGGGPSAASSQPDLSASPTLTYAATGVGVILGTAAYMSPEQARGKAVDRRTDIWSYGCVLYECLTGRQLFSGETVSDTIARILEREPDWSALPPSTPANIRHLIQRCLEKDAKRRLRDIGEARLEIEGAQAPRLPAPAAASAAAPATGHPALATGIAWTLAAALAVATLVLALPRLMHRGAPAAPVRFAVDIPGPGSNLTDGSDVAISPDGRTLVFCTADTSGTAALWVRPLDSRTPRRLPGTENAALPFWSPDSRWVGFFADGKLKKVGLGGVAPEVLCDANNGRGAAWSPNHVIVFAPSGEGPLCRVPDHGGDPVPVTHLDATRHETAHRFPCFLPDGRRFLYMALPDIRGRFNILAGSVDGQPGRLVTANEEGAIYAAPGYLLFKHNGIITAQRFDAGALRVVGDPLSLEESDGNSQYTSGPVLSASRTGVLAHPGGTAITGQLVWADRTGQRVGVVPAAPARYQALAVSADGRNAVAQIASGPSTTDLWLIDLERGTSSRFTFGPAAVENPLWSPDGRSIVFDSNPDGPWNLFVKPVDGSSSEQAIYRSPVVFKHPTAWSFDGRYIVFEALDASSGFDLWVVPMDGDRKARPYLTGPFNQRWGTISPDGRWLAYASNESGKPEIYVQSFPTPGSKHQVSLGGGIYPLWRNDGRELQFTAPDGVTVMSVDVQTGPEFRSGTPRALLKLPKNLLTAGNTVDFQRYLFAVPTDANASNPVEVMLDWPAALAKP
jgi:eukaryotic-like serine/threonine-protein kinase